MQPLYSASNSVRLNDEDLDALERNLDEDGEIGATGTSSERSFEKWQRSPYASAARLEDEQAERLEGLTQLDLEEFDEDNGGEDEPAPRRRENEYWNEDVEVSHISIPSYTEEYDYEPTANPYRYECPDLEPQLNAHHPDQKGEYFTTMRHKPDRFQIPSYRVSHSSLSPPISSGTDAITAELRQEYEDMITRIKIEEETKRKRLMDYVKQLETEVETLKAEKVQVSTIRATLEREKELDILTLRKGILQDKEKALQEIRREMVMQKDEYEQKMSDELTKQREEFERHRKQMERKIAEANETISKNNMLLAECVCRDRRGGSGRTQAIQTSGIDWGAHITPTMSYFDLMTHFPAQFADYRDACDAERKRFIDDLRQQHARNVESMRKRWAAEKEEMAKRSKQHLNDLTQQFKARFKTELEKRSAALKEQSVEAYRNASTKLRSECSQVIAKRDEMIKKLISNQKARITLESICFHLTVVQAEVHVLKSEIARTEQDRSALAMELRKATDDHAQVVEELKANYIKTLTAMRDDVARNKQLAIARLETEWHKRKLKLEAEWHDKRTHSIN
ncbi:hypothetical protein BJ742DRAFT_780754 [Cladochytrium replicatum]|nr:hypothetical protein BJ742DRAFT_780754 [Cladochytrium replicatum]